MIKLSYLLDVSSGIPAFVIAIATAKLISIYVIKYADAYIYIWIYALLFLLIPSYSYIGAAVALLGFSVFKPLLCYYLYQDSLKTLEHRVA